MSYSNHNIFSATEGVDQERFLSHFWQKKPLLFRRAFAGLSAPFTPEELAGIALEPEAESRIIIEDGRHPWELQRGPFEEQDFLQLPATHWTLLVQQADVWFPELQALFDAFDFIPRWQIDDIMASYAPVGGSVGPHYDQYDVFLLQIAGKRRWQLGQTCDVHSELLTETELSILKQFDLSDEWVLEPGDMLYVPPELAHWGVSESKDCITLSIGFRPPSQQQFLSDWADLVLEEVTQEQFMRIRPKEGHLSNYQIPITEASTLRQAILEQISDAELLQCLGEFVTRPKNEAIWNVEETTSLDPQSSIHYEKRSGSRFAFTVIECEVLLFIDGKTHRLPTELLEFAKTICESDVLIIDNSWRHSSAAMSVIAYCVDDGSLTLVGSGNE